MKKITLCAAAVAAVTGMTAITSQAAVITYVTGGNCGDFNVNGNGFSGNIFSDNNCGSMGNQFYGSGCSGDQILEMLVPSVSGSSCGDMWDGGCVSVLPGIQNFPLIPGCSGTEGDILRPNLPSPDCPVTPGCQEPGGGNTGTQNPGDQNPGIENPGTQNPGTQNPGTQNPGTQNPGTQNPGTQNPGTQNPGTQNPGTQNPDVQFPGTQNPGTQKPGTQKPGTENPGSQIPGSEDTYVQQVIALVNEERAKAGLSPVTENPDVSAAAAVRAQEITGSFSHTRPNGTYYDTVLSQGGISYRGSGENIAYGQQSAAAVMSGWMNSQGHRANILNGNFTGIGVACYENSRGVKYWVQLFVY